MAGIGAKQGVAFGPFRLSASERLLERDGTALPLSSRALDILIVLVEHAGEVVGKKELLSRAWPKLTVDESALRVHVAGLRKALGDGQDGARYVTNIPGRGYCFVAPVTPFARPQGTSIAEPGGTDQPHRLPPRLTRMVGRDETVRTITELLTEQRFVTIHGPGGIGKTTVAIAVGHAQLPAFEGAVHFVDLASLSDPSLVPTALAAALGLPVQSWDPTSTIVKFLHDRRMLLILDSCEHVIEMAAAVAERIFQETAQASILATSREALRVEGEQVYRLAALESPPEGGDLTAAQVLAFPAVHLFVERAAASGHRVALTDADARIVAEMCRKLDGIALAIELAAGRVSAHGLSETAVLLDNRLRLLWRGRRTALPRHQTLNATLDWSYDLISDLERAVLRRLSVFVGAFSLQAAQAVAADDAIDAAQVTEALAQLVAKSLVPANHNGTSTWYRLLDTTRAYAHAKLTDCGETDLVARKHANHQRELLERANATLSGDSHGERLAAYAAQLENVRAALRWSFSNRGDVRLGIELAASSARMFVELSLLSECQHWTKQALEGLDETTRGTRSEMELQSGLGYSLMYTRGNNEQAHAALARGLELAEEFKDRFNQFRLLRRLHMYHRRRGNSSRMLSFAQRAEAVAADIGDPEGMAAASVLLGVSHNLGGNQVEARKHLEALLRQTAASRSASTDHFGFGRSPRIPLARTLWLQGYPDQAVAVARQAVEETAAHQDLVTSCIALIWAVSVFHWAGDWTSGEEYTDRLIAHATRHSLEPYLVVGHGLKGELLVKRGEIDRGIDLLRGSLASLHAEEYELYTPEFSCAMAEGLAATGRLDQSSATIDDTIANVERNGCEFNMPELLRIRGELLARMANERGAEENFRQSIAWADRQSALSWRLRGATSFARLRLRQGRREEARAPLAETYARFNEGFGTADLKAAKQLLNELGPAPAPNSGRQTLPGVLSRRELRSGRAQRH